MLRIPHPLVIGTQESIGYKNDFFIFYSEMAGEKVLVLTIATISYLENIFPNTNFPKL